MSDEMGFPWWVVVLLVILGLSVPVLGALRAFGLF